jgi:hypothetical protein
MAGPRADEKYDYQSAISSKRRDYRGEVLLLPVILTPTRG